MAVPSDSQRTRKTCLAWLLLGMICTVRAGGFEPLAPSGAKPTPGVGQATPPGRQILEAVFPVYTPSMSPGRIPLRQSRLPKGWRGRPLAIVGDDRLSWRWLDTHARQLQALGARVLVAEVTSQTRFMAMARAFPGLRLAPAPADELAKAFGLTHWPVLISREWIEQ